MTPETNYAKLGDLHLGGEVLVSSTVRDLVAGSGLVFDDRGVHELKGVPGGSGGSSAPQRVDGAAVSTPMAARS